MVTTTHKFLYRGYSYEQEKAWQALRECLRRQEVQIDRKTREPEVYDYRRGAMAVGDLGRNARRERSVPDKEECLI